ncbi:right-handed parallel beta-helix repeat-containing protein [Draconibacterium orientale]|uniref:right-handed parallel beta-helix repeat-containing protein n=1 Tax=Draconibacterium orientale TaxID=1168034 RepID=UPI002A0A1812|nr:right-handed parallel beta-helix repeat-containing protein [Draconibacterium orientale]
MKSIIKLLFFAACVGLFAGCEKDELIPDQNDPMLKKAVKVMVQPCSSADVLTKAETDWQNISEALQNAEPGTTVQLAAGTFYLQKSVVCWDFNGMLKGAGIGKTIIRTAPGMLFDVSDCPPVNWSFEDNNGSFFIAFPHNYFEGERTVGVSDLTIIVDEPTDREANQTQNRNSLHGIMVYNIDLDNDRDHLINLNVNYKNLSLVGEDDPVYNYNGYSLFSGISAYGYSNGIFEAKNVAVENASGCVKPHAFYGPDAKVVIKNCHFNNCYHGVFAFYDHSWTIQNNRIENSEQALALLKRGPKNDNPWEGIVVPNGLTYIKNNRIEFEGTDAMGIGLRYVANAEIKDNVVEGSSGKYGGIVSLGGNNWIIKDNNLCGVSTKPIYLLFSSNFEIQNNYNQVITPVACSDLVIGEGYECE